MAPAGYTYVSPGMYRNRQGQVVRWNPPKPPTVNKPPTTGNPGQQGNNTNNNQTQTNVAPQPPQGLRPENLPLFNLLNNSERQKFLNMRAKDPRAALRWMQQTTNGRQTTSATPDAPPPSPDQGATPQIANATQSPAPQTPVPDFANYQSPMTKALMDAMGKGMSTMQAYEPQSFEGSPLYQFQKQKGLADLEKLMAARGLTGSGAEIQGNSDFLAQLNATEAEKQRQYAEANRDRQQRAMEFIASFDKQERDALRDQWNTDLDRQQNISQFEANRGDRRQEMGVNFLNNILGLQAQNDIARMSQAGMANQTDLTKALLNAMTQNIMSQVPRGGGGGGGSAPPPQPSNNAALYEILMNYGNRAGNNDFFNGLLRMIGG